MAKSVKFTNKETNETIGCHVGNIGEHVYAVTKDVNEMNSAIRWCNKHGSGETLEHDLYSIVIY